MGRVTYIPQCCLATNKKKVTSNYAQEGQCSSLIPLVIKLNNLQLNNVSLGIIQQFQSGFKLHKTRENSNNKENRESGWGKHIMFGKDNYLVGKHLVPEKILVVGIITYSVHQYRNQN